MPDHVWLNARLGERPPVIEFFRIKNGEQPLERIGFSLMRSHGKQQNIGRRFPQPHVQPETGDGRVSSGHLVGFINYDQIPISVTNIQKAFQVVFIALVFGPAPLHRRIGLTASSGQMTLLLSI